MIVVVIVMIMLVMSMVVLMRMIVVVVPVIVVIVSHQSLSDPTPKPVSPETWGACAMVAAEVGLPGRFLPGLDDPPADGARAGEQGLQRVAVAGADRGGDRPCRSSMEAAKDFEHGILVGQEHVAPHHRIGGGDAGEVAEARLVEYFITSLWVTSSPGPSAVPTML